MDDFDKMILRDFVAENWSAFEAFCEERGESVQELYEKLCGESE